MTLLDRPPARRAPNRPLAPPLRYLDRRERIARGALEPCEQCRYDGDREEGRRAAVWNLGGGSAELREGRARMGAQVCERRLQPRRIAAGFRLFARDAAALQ